MGETDAVGEGVGEREAPREEEGEGVTALVGVPEGVLAAVPEMELVGESVEEGVAEPVAVAVGVTVAVSLPLGVLVIVGEGVTSGVGWLAMRVIRESKTPTRMVAFCGCRDSGMQGGGRGSCERKSVGVPDKARGGGYTIGGIRKNTP